MIHRTFYTLINYLKIEPYETIGEDRLMRYKSFIDELKLYVLSRLLTPLIKFNHLRTCVKGDAFDLVKSFSHSD